MSTERKKLGALVLAMVLAGACASIVILWATPHGPGVSPDSTVYIETANSLVSKNGFFAYGEPLTHFPPTYPLLLAVTGFLQHADILQASRWLGALFFGANIVLLGIAVQACTERSLLATGTAMLLFLSHPQLIRIHSMAWSEPPFIMFTLAGLFLLAQHLVWPRTYLLLGSSFFIGLALTTRYVGIALLPPMIFALFFFGSRPMVHKTKDAVIATSVASLPLVCWLVRNLMTVQSATDRTFAIHPFGFAHAFELINTIYNFVLPIDISGVAKALHVALAAALFVVAISLLRNKNYITCNENSVRIVLPALCLAFTFAYIAVLMISVSFFDAIIPFDYRVLSPVFLTLTVATISLAWSLSQALDRRFIWYGFVFLVSVSIAINGVHAISVTVDIHNNGRGYNSRPWQNSEVISYLSEIRDGRKVYSDEAEAVRFLAEKEAVSLPEKTFKFTRSLNNGYKEQLNRIFGECAAGKVLVVYFNPRYLRDGKPGPTDREVIDANLPVLARFKDGIVYGRIPVG